MAEVSDPQSPEEWAAEYRIEADKAAAEGDLARASHTWVVIGEARETAGDRGGAESAFRRAVALARQVDAQDPELVMYAFTTLSDFLAPSEESVRLAEELVESLERREMFHPLRALNAERLWARALLKLVAVDPSRIDEAVRRAGIAADLGDRVCSHDVARQLRRDVALTLHAAGRDDEATWWETTANQWGDWDDDDMFDDLVIPGHVHLWDLIVGPPPHAGDDGSRANE